MLINYGAVSLFGSILSASFCGALGTVRDRRIFSCAMIGLLLMQGVLYSVWDVKFLRYIYPVTNHVPLIAVLYFLTRKPLWSVISVMTAYLCCQLRHWLALLIAALASGGIELQNMIEIVVTMPLLWLLLRFAAPAIRKLAAYPPAMQLNFGVLPILYYVFDYATVVYTDLLHSGAPVAVEFMPFVCCIAYIVFLLYHSAEEQKQAELREKQKNLDIQLRQSVQEINTLRESQMQAKRYRHDLRHHLQYIASCIDNGQTGQAKLYISDICQELDAHKVLSFCENEAANLILSAFHDRAEKDGITMKVQGTLCAVPFLADRDLCVLLSNALENALHACQLLTAAGGVCTIDVQFYTRENKFFLQVVNPCRNNVRFENGIPVSDRVGHGIGVQSICAIVQKYGGICTFLVKDGKFILRLSV